MTPSARPLSVSQRVRGLPPRTRGLLVLGAQLAAGWILARLLGGSSKAPPYWFYVPILYAAVRFGLRGALPTSLVAAVLAGPLLPLDLATHTAQPPQAWLSRAAAFIVVGAALALGLERRLPWLRTDRSAERLRHEFALAIARDELFLEYQPVIDLSSGRIVGAEALVRWMHPRRGRLAPDQFVPAAEENGLVVALGEWVLREACGQAARWKALGRTGLEHFTVAVNVSARQLERPDLVATIEGILEDAGLDGSSLVVEITETALVGDVPTTQHCLAALRALGIGIAVDDFGTGYASLTYVHDLAADLLKIDRQFVAGAGSRPDDNAIISAVVHLAHTTGKTVVAEGVETAEQVVVLRDRACDAAQGYYFFTPLPPNEFTTVLLGDTSGPTSRDQMEAPAAP